MTTDMSGEPGVLRLMNAHECHLADELFGTHFPASDIFHAVGRTPEPKAEKCFLVTANQFRARGISRAQLAEAGSTVFAELRTGLYLCPAHDAAAPCTHDHQAVRQFRTVRAHAEVRVRACKDCAAKNTRGTRRVGRITSRRGEAHALFTMRETKMHG
jgi:hypothetical protein